ncbi:MAG: hypothetical protein ACREYF_19425 [Gammaproteobacteria bacterium]
MKTTPAPVPPTPLISGMEAYDADFRNNFHATFGIRGYSYDRCAPAYEFGYTIAVDPRYHGQEWMTIETEARREWELRHEDAWEEFKDAVRYAWDRVHGLEHRVQLTV